MQLSPYSILPLFTSISGLSLGLLVFVKNKNSKLSMPFLGFCIPLSMWPLCYSIIYSIHSYTISLFLGKLACFSVIICSACFYHIILQFLNIRNKEKVLIYCFYFIFAIFLPILFLTDKFISGLYTYYFGFYSKAGPYYHYLLIVFYYFMLRPIYLLIEHMRTNKLSPKQRIQAKYFLMGFSFTIIASIDFLPKYNIEIYPVGSFFAFCWVATMTYAILKHQLLDINIVIKRSLVYSVLITALSIIFLGLVLLIERFSQGILGYDTRIGSVLAALLIASIFAPLRNIIQQFVDKRLFKATTSELAEQVEYYKKESVQTEKLKAISTLASGMAHEVKNPLTAIKTFAEYLPEKWEDPEFRQKFSKIVGSEVDRIDNIVHQLLEFAKPSPLQLKKTDICKLLNDTLAFLNSEFLKNKIIVKKEFPINKSILIQADASRLKQGFLNLFLNAIESMDKGGIITIDVKKGIGSGVKGTGTSKPQTLEPEPSISIFIKDTGTGIKKEDLSHIFDPFFSKKDNGTGLGLSITQQIIKEHNGTIEVESTKGKGTAFIIKLQNSTKRS